MCNSTAAQPFEVHSSNVLIMEGHSNVVRSCAWSPAGLRLATGSADHTARIWAIADWTNSKSLENRIGSVRVLKHDRGRPDKQRKDVTSVAWNLDGTLLATSSMDGLARIWNTKGDLISTFSKHRGSIRSIKWNKKEYHLLTASNDNTTIVWDVLTGPVLDIDWRNNQTFASSSVDGMIYVCKIGEDQPIRAFPGHTVIHLTRLRRPSSSKSSSSSKKLPVMSDNLIYDMDSTTSPSDDSDSSTKKKHRVPILNNVNKEELRAPSLSRQKPTAKSSEQPLQSISPPKERSLNQQANSAVI